MKPNLCMAIIFPFFILWNQTQQAGIDFTMISAKAVTGENPYACVGDIKMPNGFSRTSSEKNSFAAWLRTLQLKKSKIVYLYNGLPKRNQTAQFAVLNISIGNKDLQQCADAVMRLRAEYLYAQKRFGEIIFRDNNSKEYKLGVPIDRKHFDKYLNYVFARCGTLSLEKQLKPLNNLSNLHPEMS